MLRLVGCWCFQVIFERPPGGLGCADENVPSRLSNRTLLAGNVLFIGKNSWIASTFIVDFPTNSLDSQPSLPSRGQTDDIATYVHTLERGGRELADWASTVESWLGQFWGRDVWFFQDVLEPTGDTRFCESIPPASGMVEQKNTQSNWIFLNGLPSFPNGPTFQCLTCLICLWPMTGREETIHILLTEMGPLGILAAITAFFVTWLL